MYPVLFEIAGIPIYSYGIMLGLSCVLGAHLAVYLSERSGIPVNRAWALAVIVIVAGLIGGRVHEIWVTEQPFSALFQLRHAGRTAYGGFLGAIASAIVASRLLKVSFWRFGDAAAPTMALGIGLTRIGCFLYGCDYGLQTNGWGVSFPGPSARFPTGSPAFGDQLKAGLIDPGAAESLPVFPVQLPSSLVGLGIFATLLMYWYYRPRRQGSVLLGFLFLYGLARAGLEALRADEGRGELLGLSTSTTIGLATAFVALVLFVPPLARLRPPLEPWPDAPPPEGKGDKS